MSPAVPKPKRFKCKAFRKFVESKICCAYDYNCRQFHFDVISHHMETVGSGGSDMTCVPLCVDHHTEWHKQGNAWFEKHRGVIMSEVRADLLQEFFELFSATLESGE